MFSGNKNVKPSTKVDSEMKFRNKRIIETFVRNADVPKWYRGLSSFQLTAASQLQYAIRDDLEQGTTHRVKALLDRIGLRPTLGESQIRFVMFLSGANDLAFLWFVKEMYYNSDNTNYSVNEQLIFSSIARLDLVFTLRGLDRVLPPQQPTKREIRRMKIAEQKNAKKRLQNASSSSENRTVTSIRIKYKLPYFDELVRPRLYEHSLISHPPACRSESAHKDIRDLTYVTPNEGNRWFAEYNLQPGKRTGVQMLTEKINEMFKEKIPKQSLLVKNVFDEHVYKNMRWTNEHNDNELQKTLCLQHKTLLEMEKTIEHELRVRAREKCLRYFDAETPKSEERIARIRRQIEQDVNVHMKQLKKLADRTRSHLQIWSQENIHDCDSKIETLWHGVAQNKCTKSERVIRQGGENYLDERNKPTSSKSAININNISEKQSNPSHSIGGYLNVQSQVRLKCCDNEVVCRSSAAEHKRKRGSSNASKLQRVRDILHNKTCDCGYKYMENYDCGHSEVQQNECNPYFKAPEENQPYKFDYQRVFHFQNDDSPLNVQNEFLKIITSDLNLNKNDPNTPKNLNEAIKQYAKKIFKESVAAKNEELAEQQKRNVGTGRRYPFLDAELDYYDPDDEKLMQNMLKNALEFLANDPKYVLASMPDAHKLPSLLSWIETRYGKEYTREQLRKVHDDSKATIHALKQMTVDVMLPSAKLLGEAIMVNYNCRDYLVKKTKKLRKEYYDKVNASIMDQSRTFYMAIKPNICGNARDTFFAYMPAREADIQQFRIWRPHEYMPAKEEFFTRKCRAMKLARRFY
ncbi:uncharacterized protein LOC118745153 [Rhagoletis pomonella]|uniref:uncharacterized protein LOC118745153 n=1 Tax=Rhagoletis pomonella TaxID=28610 RepID=UPI001781B8E1|nr:uncharacterized protein LOC118745153 [Rhagoletis pomonella]